MNKIIWHLDRETVIPDKYKSLLILQIKERFQKQESLLLYRNTRTYFRTCSIFLFYSFPLSLSKQHIPQIQMYTYRIFQKKISAQ